MEAFINSFLIIFLGEIGDKTQLLTLVLVARYKKPWTIFFAILVATLLNHAFASLVGNQISQYIDQKLLGYILSITFIVFAFWVLIPDKEEDVEISKNLGVFVSVSIAFFLAEMGDKTQLATVALGAKYSNTIIVTLATTLGMLLANAIPLIFGEKILRKVPLKIIRIITSIIFFLFGAVILINNWNS